MSNTPGALRYHAALLVAVTAVSSSAVIVRWADMGAVSLAFWRTAGGAVVLGATAAAVERRVRLQRARRRHLIPIVVSGLCLAFHMSAWMASLELTSVAASVTLVSTAPLLIVLYRAATGRPPTMRTWGVIALGVAGTAVITGGDLGGAGRDALLGDALALVGAATVAGYLIIGDRVRAELSTSVYAGLVYATSAVVLLPLALVVDGGLGGYDRSTWLAIGAMIVGPQLAGHTMINLLLKPLGSVTVSVALLTESVGATVAVWAIFGEIPPVTAVAGGVMVLAALALHLLGAGAATGAPAGDAAADPTDPPGRPDPPGPPDRIGSEA